MGSEKQSRVCKTCGASNIVDKERCWKCQGLLDIELPKVDMSNPRVLHQPPGKVNAPVGSQQPAPKKVTQLSRRFLQNGRTRLKTLPLWMKIVAIVVLSVFVAGGIVITRVKDREIGGLDLIRYCQSFHYQTAKLRGKRTADDWECVDLKSEQIDMTQACNREHHRDDLKDQEDNPGVWSCRTPKNESVGGIIDLVGFCKEKGYHIVKDGYCTYQPHSSIDMTQACIWQYHRNDTWANTSNHSDYRSWQCYVRFIDLG